MIPQDDSPVRDDAPGPGRIADDGVEALAEVYAYLLVIARRPRAEADDGPAVPTSTRASNS